MKKMKILSVLATLLLAVTLAADSTLHPTPPPHPDAVPDGITDTVHPGVMNTAGVNPRWAGLAAGWKLDESSDGSVAVVRADVLGTYDMTDNNTTPSATGIIGNGILPAAANQENLSNSSVPTFTGDVTILVWVKRTGNFVNGESVVGRYTGANTSSTFKIYASDATHLNILTVSGSTQSLGSTPLSLTLNAWSMLTFRKAAGSSAATLTLNDNADSTSTSAVGQPNTGAALAFHIGSNSTPAQFCNNTVIDGVYYFPDVLKSDTWISGMYNAGLGVTYPN